MKHEKQVQKLCDAVGISRPTFGRWRRLPGFPKATAAGWPVGAVLKFTQARFAEQAAKVADGDNDDTRAVKLAILEQRQALLAVSVRRSEREDEVEAGKMIRMEDSLATAREMCALVVGAFNQFQAEVDRTLDPVLSDKVAAIIRRTRQQLADKCAERAEEEKQKEKEKKA